MNFLEQLKNGMIEKATRMIICLIFMIILSLFWQHIMGAPQWASIMFSVMAAERLNQEWEKDLEK